MFTIIAQKTTTSAATTSRIERKRRASSLIARAEPAKPKLKKAVSLSFSFLLRRKRVTRIFGCTIETNARDFLSLSLSLSLFQSKQEDFTAGGGGARGYCDVEEIKNAIKECEGTRFGKKKMMI